MSETLSISQYRAGFANPRFSKARKKPAHNESELQQACVRWFRHQYAKHAPLLFAIPNGGKRSKVEAAIMQAEGVTPGVSDLMLAIPCKEYHGLFIEMKWGKNKQTESQKEFEVAITAAGYRYDVVYTSEAFIELVSGYMKAALNYTQLSTDLNQLK